MILETKRLYARPLHERDASAFFALMSNPKVMEPIPQKPLNQKESTSTLTELIQLEKSSSTKIWGLCKKETNAFIGICGVLKNNEQQDEIAYRLLEQYWGNGFGTEIARGLIEYCFLKLNSTLVSADVYVNNVKSIKIVEKYFTVKNEFFNLEDNCIDRRYILSRESWLKLAT